MIRSLIPIAFLTVAAHAWQPAPDSMLTDWGAKITPDQAWREYPRPALAREQWSNLNGLWKYAVTPKTADTAPAEWVGDILVPFAIESALSGVKKRITAEDAIWYRREISAAKSAGKRTLLHFEAVDYQSTVWINDTKVGENTGGNLPFSFDITHALKDGFNTLTLKVTDSSNQPDAYQLHGKQVLKPGGIWYTPVSGIWQTVWMEEVPGSYIRDLKITPRIDGSVHVKINEAGDLRAGEQIAKVTASLDGKQVAEAVGSSESITLRIPEPKLWSPASPTLYDLQITLGKDTVKSYTGLRETTVMKDANGHLRLALNGKEIFHLGTLDQGWWPDGLLTPPSDEAMASDIKFLKEAGFNTIRKHIKVEPRRYYTHCDRIGMLVWQDQVSSGTGKDADRIVSPKWTRLQPNPEDAVWPDAAHAQYMKELKLMMDTLHNHPSIVQWVPFNEAWGQHRTVEVGKWAVAYDPTRQVNIASGGNFWPAGHIVDHHEYPHPAFPFNLGDNGRFDGFIKIVGEFGGHGFPVKDHLWNSKAKNWGYGGLPKNKEEWIERYKTSIKKLADLRKVGIAGGIYTQTTDVEGEINGLITYDRKVQKLSPAELAKISLDLTDSDKAAAVTNTSGIQQKTYGKMPDGREVKIFTLTNKNGLKARVTEYGAILVSMETPDKSGKSADLTHGYDTLAGWLTNTSYFGATVGRFGNRIANGKFTLDGKEYSLATNNKPGGIPCHLHGGIKGFDKVLWSGKSVGDNGVEFTYVSKDSEEGYPGNLSVTVTYSLNDDNELKWEAHATTDAPTVINLVHHSYWNLSGDPSTTINDHHLTLNAPTYLPTDAGLIPTGQLAQVAGTPMDFTKATAIGARVKADFEALKFGGGYDHAWVLEKVDGVRLAARLKDPKSGRVMEISTNQPAIQFYGGNFLDGTVTGKGGVNYAHRTALCLETEGFPDAPNKTNFPSPVLRPGETYKHVMVHKFSAE